MKLLYFFAFHILFFTKVCHAFFQNDFFITDLQSTSSADFLNEASSWAISSAVCSSCSQTSISIPNTCTNFAQEFIYGGPNVLGPSGGDSLGQNFQRQYSGVKISGPEIAIAIDFWIFTSNQIPFAEGGGTNDVFSIKVNTKSYSWSAYRYSSCFLTYTNGQGVTINYLYKLTYFGFFSFSGTTLTLQIKNKLAGPSTLNSFGFRNVRIFTGSFNGQIGPTVADFDRFPCLEHYFWNGTACEPICSSPCATCFGIKDNECITCQSSFYNYNNGSCLENCDSPFVKQPASGQTYCQKKCPTSFYWHHNYSCSETCLNPLTHLIDENNWDICYNPCSLNNTFLYPNGDCMSTCPKPLDQKLENGVKYCVNPCPNSYFYETDKTCKSTCISPYESKTINDVKICVLTDQLAPEEAEKTKSTVAMIASQGQATQVGLKATSSFNSANPALALLAGQASMLFYIRYIDLGYSAKLKLFFLLQDASPFSFTLGIDMPNALEERLRDRELPKVFEEYDLHSNFLYNSWDMLTSLLLALVLILGVTVVKVFTRRWKKIDRIIGGILSVLKWNIPLAVVCGGFGDIYFYASFQLQSTSFDSISDVLCLILSIFMMFVGAGILVITVKIVKDLLKKSPKDKKWQNFEMLFESYERTSITTFGYMAMFLGRMLIFNFIIANLYNYPFVQSILINILTISMFSYLVIKRPLKNLLELTQLFLNELFVIIVNVCVLIIAIMDKAGIKGQELRDGVCETIMKVIIIFSSSALAFIALQILIGLYLLYKWLKRLKTEGKLSFSGILKAWLDGEESEERKKLEDKEKFELISTTERGLRSERRVNPNLSQLRLFDSQTEDKTISQMIFQAPEIKKESDMTLNYHSHFDPFKKSLVSKAPQERTREDLFEKSQLIMESNHGSLRVIPIDPYDFAGNQRENMSLAHVIEKNQERMNEMRRFRIMSFQDNEEK